MDNHNSIHTPPPDLDQFDILPDSLLLLIFNKISDVKSLGRCCVVSRRFHSLVPQVDNVLVRVDCVISDDDPSTSSASSSSLNNNYSNNNKYPNPFSSFLRVVLGNIVKPIQALGLMFGPKRPNDIDGDCGGDGDRASSSNTGGGLVTHHSPTQVLKNFNDIKFLKIELPSGELGVEGGVLLKWKANFGSTLDNCVILGAASVIDGGNGGWNDEFVVNSRVVEDNGSIPESFYTNGGLKLRVVWTISSLIAASARHYLLQPIIAEHKTLDSLVLTDADGQGVLCMNRDQLEELRVKPLSASSASKRTLVPALNMKLWYAPHLELPGGVILKGATLVAIRPSEQSTAKKEVSGGSSAKKEVSDGSGAKEVSDLSWVSSAFEEPYGTAAQMLVKRRIYCLEMNSF